MAGRLSGQPNMLRTVAEGLGSWDFNSTYMERQLAQCVDVLSQNGERTCYAQNGERLDRKPGVSGVQHQRLLIYTT